MALSSFVRLLRTLWEHSAWPLSREASGQKSSERSGDPISPSMDFQGKRGAGAFQWNRGGWFGAQVGSTLWLVLLGSLLLIQSRPVGGWVVLFGVVPNLLGCVLWSRRHTLSPYPAIQLLIAGCGVCALLAWAFVWADGVPGSSSGMPGPWFLLMYPGLMVAFYFQERAAREAA